LQELRDEAADIAAKSAEILLQDALSKRSSKLVDEAIADIPRQAA
jgi:F0F1-type ATP synthase membrane subunit b/b'